jgi:hypothetical protein
MNSPEDNLLSVVTKELDWYRDKTMLRQTIKEVARDALVDLVADSIREKHLEYLQMILNEDVFKEFQSRESIRLLLKDNRDFLMKEAARRAIRREILRRLELPESVDQLDLPWSP